MQTCFILFYFIANILFPGVPVAPAFDQVQFTTTGIEATIDLQKIARSHKLVTLKAVLVICDNYESPENNGIAQSVRVDMGTLTQLLNVLEKRNIVKVERILLQGKKATLANITSTLKGLQTGSDDVVLFYFSGHGGMQNSKTFLVTADEKDLQRSTIESLVRQTSARLKVIVSDACSNDVDGFPATRSLNRGNQKIDAGEFDEIYKDLFLGYQGLLHISSSSEGEYAWSDNKFGGFFTYHFFKEGLVKKPINDWAGIFVGARDKTSQMFMRNVSSEDRNKLAKEGVKNQTAKAFSFPKIVGSLASGNTDKPGKNGLPDQQQGMPATSVTSETGISIDNYTKITVNFYLDDNSPTGKWFETKTRKFRIGAGKSLAFKQVYALLGFAFNGSDYYYELEKGNYFFALDQNGILDLYYKDDYINAGNYNTVAQKDFQQIMIGQWEWVDGGSGETVVSTFQKNTFTDEFQQQNIKETGSWSVHRETFDNEEFTIATFIYKDDGMSAYELDYIVMYDEEYPDELQLVFLSATENGKEISYAEAEEYLEPTIIMYRIN